jgi:hypothetical protein
MQAEYKTCAVVLKALRARKKTTGDCNVSKSAQVPGLPFEESVEPKSGYWVGQMSLLSKIDTKKCLMASHRQWILWPGHPKHSQNHP